METKCSPNPKTWHFVCDIFVHEHFVRPRAQVVSNGTEICVFSLKIIFELLCLASYWIILECLPIVCLRGLNSTWTIIWNGSVLASGHRETVQDGVWGLSRCHKPRQIHCTLPASVPRSSSSNWGQHQWPEHGNVSAILSFYVTLVECHLTVVMCYFKLENFQQWIILLIISVFVGTNWIRKF